MLVEAPVVFKGVAHRPLRRPLGSVPDETASRLDEQERFQLAPLGNNNAPLVVPHGRGHARERCNLALLPPLPAGGGAGAGHVTAGGGLQPGRRRRGA